VAWLCEMDRVGLLPALKKLTEAHRTKCSAYANILANLYSGYEGVPWLPVGLFKTLKLLSVPDADVYRVLTSSGTTGKRSRVYIDRDTARNQSMALASVMRPLLGPERRPMLIVDSPGGGETKAMSASRAAVTGMRTFGRDYCFALVDDTTPNGMVRSWLGDHRDEPIFVFGLTAKVWQLYTHGVELDLSHAVLVHGGGWKKLEAQAVDRATFKRCLGERFGLKQIVNYYGMVEQMGNVFLECSEGALHPAPFADVIVRDPLTLREQPIGQEGVLQVLSAIPTSYPGHSLLTEDRGRIVACGCGQGGRAFEVLGRMQSSAVRGCSDA